MMMNLPCLRGSCPNFLRSIYHSLSASQAPKRGHAPRKKTMPATALVFMFDCYWPAFTCRGTDLLSGRYTISGSCWPFADAVRSGLHHLRVSIPEPCPVSDASHQQLDRVLECVTYISLFPMLPSVPVLLPGVWYLSTVSADHKLSLSSGLCKSPSVSCRLSQPVTASFSVDGCFGLCNTHAAVWIHPHATLLTLPPETASNAVSCVLCSWSLSVLYACRSCMPPDPFHLTSGFPLHHQTCWCRPILFWKKMGLYWTIGRINSFLRFFRGKMLLTYGKSIISVCFHKYRTVMNVRWKKSFPLQIHL